VIGQIGVCLSVRFFSEAVVRGSVKRREFLAGAVSAVCVGAVGASRGDEFGSQQPRLDSEWPTSTPSTDDQGTTTDGGSESAAVEEEPAPRSTLEVVSTASGETPVRLRVVHAQRSAVVHDDVRALAYGERAYLSGLLERGASYRFTLAVDGATLVRETVSPGEHAVYELLDETTVSVVA
jgi:hypothetical protein